MKTMWFVRNSFLLLLLLLLSACYSFRGISIPEGVEKAYIPNFQDNAIGAPPTLYLEMTESLRDKVRDEARLIIGERNQIREAQSLPDNYVVTFGAQHSIGWRFYPAWLQAFEQAFGPIMSRLRADDLPGCLKDLLSGELDFVISYDSRYFRTADSAPAIESIVIGEDSLIPVCKATSAGEPMFELAGSSAVEAPYLRFGHGAPISAHIEPLLAANHLTPKLKVVYENAMAGALRIRAREGAGIAWLPRSLIAPDLESGLLVRIGQADWETRLEICLHRLRKNANSLTGKIWSFLSTQQTAPLLTKI